MLKEERHELILDELRKRNRILLPDIATKLSVSEDTVRRDLKELHTLGKLKKVHGGAIANSFDPFSFRQEDIYDHPNKLIIANKAVSLIKRGQSVLITGGTTNLELINLLPKDLRCTFLTPSIHAAMRLAQYKNIETIVIGGRVSTEAKVTLGGEALSLLGRVNADLCFLGTGHLDAAFGLSEFDWEVVELKRAIIKASRKVVSLTLSEKLNSIQRYKVCDIKEINALVTELNPSDKRLDRFGNEGLEII